MSGISADPSLVFESSIEPRQTIYGRPASVSYATPARTHSRSVWGIGPVTPGPLEFEYSRSDSVRDLRAWIRDCIGSISLAFDGYGGDHTRGPGLYIAIVATRTVADFAEPMGANRWPTDVCPTVRVPSDSFHEAAATVADSRDGGVCIGVDGTVLEQMVRFGNVRNEDVPEGVDVNELEYADWMGARHMSAYETSARPDVVATITLSEETGRVTTFRDGSYETVTRDRIGDPWRGEEAG